MRICRTRAVTEKFDHTAAARAKGLTDEQYAELTAIIGMANETNALTTTLQISVDPEFLVE